MEFKFIDLFAGIGGMRLAFESVGGQCVYSSEWNEFSQKTYKANFGEQPDGDITKVDAASIPDHDILVRETLEQQGIRCVVVWECTIRKMQKDAATESAELEQLICTIT